MLASQHTRVRKRVWCVSSRRLKRIWKRKARRRRGCLKEDPLGITLPRASLRPTLHPSAKAIDSLIYAYLNNWTRSGLANEPDYPSHQLHDSLPLFIRWNEQAETVFVTVRAIITTMIPVTDAVAHRARTITITLENNGGARLTRLLIINAIENNGGRASPSPVSYTHLADSPRRHAFRFPLSLSLASVI